MSVSQGFMLTRLKIVEIQTIYHLNNFHNDGMISTELRDEVMLGP